MENVPKNRTNLGERITTASIGLADAKARDIDINGYILNQRDIENAVRHVFASLGIKDESIRAVRVGATNSQNSNERNKLRIVAEISLRALRQRKRDNDWFTFEDGDSGSSKDSFFPEFYDATHNKLYHGKRKHLRWRKITRKGEDFAAIDIDPEIFISFIYNLVFTDPYLNITATPDRWKAGRDLDDMSGKERQRYMRMKEDYSNDRMIPCTIFVKFGAKSFWKDKQGNIVKGFSPTQVDEWYEAIDAAEAKKNYR